MSTSESVDRFAASTAQPEHGAQAGKRKRWEDFQHESVGKTAHAEKSGWHPAQAQAAPVVQPTVVAAVVPPARTQSNSVEPVIAPGSGPWKQLLVTVAAIPPLLDLPHKMYLIPTCLN